MCLGIPGLIVEVTADNPHLARVDVAGVQRLINIGLLEEDGVTPGDWVLIHVGFAMAVIDEQEAARALEGLQLMGQAYTDELDAVRSSRIDSGPLNRAAPGDLEEELNLDQALVLDRQTTASKGD